MNKSSSAGKSAQAPPRWQERSRQPLGQSIQSSVKRELGKRREFFLALALRQRAKSHARRLLVVSCSSLRAASTMQTGCCTP